MNMSLPAATSNFTEDGPQVHPPQQSTVPPCETYLIAYICTSISQPVEEIDTFDIYISISFKDSVTESLGLFFVDYMEQ